MPHTSKTSSDKAGLGRAGENVVARMLEQKGATILARNYRSKYGEIDIIAQKGDTIAFVEVKRRVKHYFALSSVITEQKQQKIAKTARFFIINHPTITCSYRFDVALIEEDAEVVYIENAFSIEDR
jgi:putative endonuclease